MATKCEPEVYTPALYALPLPGWRKRSKGDNGPPAKVATCEFFAWAWPSWLGIRRGTVVAASQLQSQDWGAAIASFLGSGRRLGRGSVPLLRHLAGRPRAGCRQACLGRPSCCWGSSKSQIRPWTHWLRPGEQDPRRREEGTKFSCPKIPLRVRTSWYRLTNPANRALTIRPYSNQSGPNSSSGRRHAARSSMWNSAVWKPSAPGSWTSTGRSSALGRTAWTQSNSGRRS